MKILLKMLEPLVTKFYPKIAISVVKKALKLQEREILEAVKEISEQGYTPVIMMNPATARGMLEIAATELDKEQKQEAKKRRFEVITNDEE